MLNTSAADYNTAAPAMPPLAAERIHELDGLRGLLAVFVALYHLLAPFTVLQSALRHRAPVFLEGWYAVDVFFMMSGFVMLHVYGRTFAQGVALPAVLRFLWARVVRLYPVHLFALLVTLALVTPMLMSHGMFLAVDGRYSLGTLVASLFMLQSPWVAYRSWNYPAWSISAEWHAYLVFPLLVWLLRKCGARTALLLVALGIAVPFLLYLPPFQQDQYPTNGAAVLLRVLPLFMAGMALHIVWPQVRRVPSALGFVVVAGTLGLLCFPQSSPGAVLLVPLLLLSALRSPWLKRCLSSAPLLWLGKISYSLYMTHALVESFVLSWGMHHLQRLGIHAAPGVAASLLAWLVGAGLSIVLGWATWKWVEVPARTFLMRPAGVWSKP